MAKHYQTLIWFGRKGREYPRVKYYEAESKDEVMVKVRKEFLKYNELLVREVRTNPHLERKSQDRGSD
ncbi:MAG: hypothetical protein JRJ66_11370 [Deltaproteobacteria bacterium]|nr:hypothetical protein [Deltaproteobacteria bacterium]MBW1921126.1 hypothetical protein [Deltaproteobacteria bacterium]